jgi:hypothetical protein
MEDLGLNGGLFLDALDFLPQSFLMEIVPNTSCFDKVWSAFYKKLAVTDSAVNRITSNGKFFG